MKLKQDLGHSLGKSQVREAVQENLGRLYK